MFAEFMYIALLVLILLWTCIEGRSSYGTSFGALLEAAFSEYIANMDYMSHSAHQRPLVALGANYSQRHKSLF